MTASNIFLTLNISWSLFSVIFNSRAQNPTIRVQWRLTIFLLQIYFPVNESGNAGNETIPFFHFSLTIDEKKSFQETKPCSVFYFYLLSKKNRRCNEMFFCCCNVAKAKKIDNIERNTFQCCNDSAATLPSNKNLIMMVRKKKTSHAVCRIRSRLLVFRIAGFFS